MLAIKGIDIADIELDMLIESCVSEFNINFISNGKQEESKNA